MIGTYDNPFAQCFLGQRSRCACSWPPSCSRVGRGLPVGLHDIMRDVAGDYGVEVAEVFGDLGPQDWLGGNDCLHPVDSGYEKVAAAFEEVLAD